MAERRRLLGSVRARITLLTALLVLLVLIVASVLLVTIQRSALVEQLDEGLEIDAIRIAADVGPGGQRPDFGGDDDRLVVVVDGSGGVVASTDGLDDVELSVLATAGTGGVTTDDESYRVASQEVEGGGSVVVASALDDVDEAVADLVRTLSWIVPAATVALAAVVWVMVGRTLGPVERMRVEVASIGLEQLDRRVPAPESHDEIARLATTMNEMLDRLQRSHQRQQRFVADASHELRTPLTRMRAELELDERHPDDADPAATRRSALEEIGTLQRMIDDLLLLARRDAGAASRSEPVDLDDLVLDEARAGSGTRVVVDISAVSAAQVVGDPAALRRVVRNLLDNARRHASSVVAIAVAERETTAVITVDDDGPGIPLDRRHEVFERFTRLDAARTGGSGGAGLGLAIVHGVVTDHHGTVEVTASPAGGARFVVTLPARR